MFVYKPFRHCHYSKKNTFLFPIFPVGTIQYHRYICYTLRNVFLDDFELYLDLCLIYLHLTLVSINLNSLHRIHTAVSDVFSCFSVPIFLKKEKKQRS